MPGSWPSSAGHGAAAGDDLRRRRHPHPHRGRHRQPAAVPHATRSASRRSAAWPATPPVGLARDKRMVENLRDRGVIRRAGGPRHRQARRHARPAGRAQRSRIWCAPRAGCTTRPSDSATGNGDNRTWKHLHFDFAGSGRRRGIVARRVLVGVVGSGNLEVLVEPAADRDACADRRQDLGARLRRRSGRRCWTTSTRAMPLAGVRVSINDMGATPAVVSLRLDQALRSCRQRRADERAMTHQLLRSDGARARSRGLLDAGSFQRVLPPGRARDQPAPGASWACRRPSTTAWSSAAARWPARRCSSPRRKARFMGGAVGEVHGAKLVGLLAARAASSGRLPCCCWSSRAACACTRPMPA